MINNRISDPFFWESKRKGCNCGSYALGVDSWFIPYNEDEFDYGGRDSFISTLFEDGRDVDTIMDILLACDEDGILEQCPWIIRVDRDEITDDDTIIAYRLALEIDKFSNDESECIFADYIDTDFHFRIRRNGIWKEKCGSEPIITCKEQTWEEFEKPWDTGYGVTYSSKILYFKYK
jgi:hypothetical protein